MTPQLLTVKIQALLGGRLELSDVQKRSLALEYYRQCGEAEAHIEHCVSLIKTGREYPAIQVAEASDLLETVNALMFPEHGVWRQMCLKEGLPVPQPFDDEQILLISSLYSKGITQAHPLYRDYRRAMRKRDWPGALSIIRTIAKINSYDAEAAREFGRLRKRVTDGVLEEIDAAMKRGDASKVSALCESIEADAELFSDNPVWRSALEMKCAEDKRIGALECRKILSELAAADPVKDWERVAELVTRFNFARGDLEFSKEDLELLESRSREASKYQDESIASERGARFGNLISLELEKNVKDAGQSLKTLASLVRDGGSCVDPEILSRAKAKMSSLRRAVFFRGFARFSMRLCALALAVFFIWAAADKMASENRRNGALSELDDIALIDDYSEFEKRMEEFSLKYADLLGDTSLKSKISALKGDMDVLKSDTDRLFRGVLAIEKTDLKTAGSKFFDEARNDLERAYSEMASLSRRSQISLKEKIDLQTKRLNSEIDRRKMENASKVRVLLDKYEAALGKYLALSGDRSEIDRECDAVLKDLRPLMEDTSRIFKAHQIDLDRYGDLSARIADARAKFAKFDSLRDALLSARTSDEYLAALDMVSISGEVPPEFSKKVSRIVPQKDAIKAGNLTDFIDMRYVGEPLPKTFTKCAFPENKIFVDVWKYSHPKRGDIYTIGEIRQTSQKWRGGGETVQYAEEINLGGRATTMVYRLTEIAGKPQRGELLSNGALSAESALGRSVKSIMEKEPALAAIKVLRDAEANAVYKAYLENMIFSELSKNPVESGLAFSDSARRRAAKVRECAAALFDYSWIFENPSKMKYLAETLYSSGSPDYFSEAAIGLETVKIAQKNPLRFVGVCDEKGVPRIFENGGGGAQWGVDSSSGLFKRIGPDSSFLPLSPIFEESMSKEDIIKSASK